MDEEKYGRKRLIELKAPEPKDVIVEEYEL